MKRNGHKVSLIELRSNTMFTQAANCFFCLHIGQFVVYVLNGGLIWEYGTKLELFVHECKFRFRFGYKTKKNKS